MLNHWKVQLGCHSQSLAHNPVVEDGLSIIGNGYGTGALQSPKVGKHCALAALRCSRYRKDIGDRSALWIFDPSHPFR
jgi:hypothetical protein